MPGTQRAGGAGSGAAFPPLNFYLTEEGLAFFYPMYAIAPAVEGIPVFTVPYDRLYRPPCGSE